MAKSLPFRLILASGSLGRRELLKLHGYDFEVRPSHIDEPAEARLGDCRHYVGELAWLKAAAVAPQVEAGVVLAADTVGWLNGRVIGKLVEAGRLSDTRKLLFAGFQVETETPVGQLTNLFELLSRERRRLVHLHPAGLARIESMAHGSVP